VGSESPNFLKFTFVWKWYILLTQNACKQQGLSSQTPNLLGILALGWAAPGIVSAA